MFGKCRMMERTEINFPVKYTPYEATQLFNRKAMALLWKNNKKFDYGQVAILKSLYDNKLKGTLNCKTPVVYTLRGKMGELGYGRYYGTKGSLETLERNIRATLCAEYYDDIDIVNCHPVLMVQLSQRLLDTPMPMLSHYVENRAKVLESICSELCVKESDAKAIIIKLINGGALTKEEKKESVLTSIHAEANAFINKLISTKQYDVLYQHCVRQKENVRGSFISTLMQTYERHCLDAMVEVLKAKGFSVDVLCYDGCMVRKGDIALTDDILKECEERIENATNFKIKLKVKPMDDERIPLDELEEKDDADDDGYEAMKELWEKNHFYFSSANTIVEETKEGYTQYPLDHAMEAFGNVWKLKGKDDDDSRSFLTKWRKDANRRTIHEFVYKHKEDCSPTEATLFTGFAYQTLTEECAELTEPVEKFNEILLNIAGNSMEHFEFLTKLFAFRIQKPFEKANICTIFTGDQGVGKDTILEWMQSIIGRRYCSMYLSDTEFWEKHDTKKEGALMMYLQEAGVGANRRNSNALKSRITSPYIDINPKGMRSYKVPNMAMYFMTTNESSPVNMEENDRRYYLLRAGNKNMGNADYWKYIYENYNKPAWMYSLGKHLERIDLTGFNPNTFPDTQERKILKELGRCPEKLFLQQFTWDDGEYNCSDLYKHYKSYCIDNEHPYKISSGSFGRELTKYLDTIVSRRSKDGCSLYSRAG